MSQAAKLSLVILLVLMLGAAGFAGFTVVEKEKLKQTNLSLQNQIVDLESREKKLTVDKKQAEDKLQQAEITNKKLQSDVDQFNSKAGDLNRQIEELAREREDWKVRMEAIQKERDELLVKLEEASKAQFQPPPVQHPVAQLPVTQAPVEPSSAEISNTTTSPVVSIDEQQDQYWAQVLKRKAELEVELQNMKNDLSTSAVEIAELKKENTDLQLELNQIENNREDIERQIKHGKDLSSTLSLELARAKNEVKFSDEKINKLTEDNNSLSEHIKELTSTKIALEKSIVQLTEEKNTIEKKLFETENVIQSRIEEIWDIKDGLDKRFKGAKTGQSSKEIELPPIIVSAQNKIPAKVAESISDEISTDTSGFNGNVVSVNEDNNFVIVDLGQNTGIKIGDQLSVYRGSKYVAGLEVIQTRQDISAADIKQKVTEIKIGDNVR